MIICHVLRESVKYFMGKVGFRIRKGEGQREGGRVYFLLIFIVPLLLSQELIR